MVYETDTGAHHPPGAVIDSQGVNFAVLSRHAAQVELLLFEKSNSPKPFQTIVLQPVLNHTFFAWHVYVKGLTAGVWYAWRMDGDEKDAGSARHTGLRFDKEKVLLDPRARVVSDKLWDRSAGSQPGDNCASAMRGMIVDEKYDWESDQPLRIPSENAIIYELHVGGFTRHVSARVKNPGTFSGLIEKIPYLQSLGITHVELLPVMAFDEQDVPERTADLGLNNYWGYSTHSFFSPHPGYCVTPENGTHMQEFRDLVKAMHAAGIGVILDVVFNHTAEGGAGGPTISFKGMGNDTYYHLDHDDKRVYRDFTGCGNTVNCNHPVVANFIISCLEFWVREMHVDGFRFDLASVLARGEDGHPYREAPVLWGIELSEPLAATRLIAEAWDAAGLYQVGSFPGYRWAEWNGLYRDTIRRFVRGDSGVLQELATRLSGSNDLYQSQNRLPINSINFVTCHDGFTLYDLFSYSEKHNSDNGEGNRDGHNDNLSFNCGVEGATKDADVLSQRTRHVKNAVGILLLSQGVPMLLAGDEVLNTQGGNNNGYCQNNDITWLDWNLAIENSDMLNFFQKMIALRKRHPSLMRRRFLVGERVEDSDLLDISWHGAHLDQPGWDDPDARVLAFTLAGSRASEADLHVMLNMSEDDLDMDIPQIAGKRWSIAVNTAELSPMDILEPALQPPVQGASCVVEARSIVVLENS